VKPLLLMLALAGCGPGSPVLATEWILECPPGPDRDHLAQMIIDCTNAGASGKQTLSGNDQDMDDVGLACSTSMQEALGCKARLRAVPVRRP
jgi:hypothetical protein